MITKENKTSQTSSDSETKTKSALLEKYEKQNKEKILFKNLRKEVETGANGTQDYIIKEGINKGKKPHVTWRNNNNT